MIINKTVLFVSEAACVLGCSSHQIYQLIHAGKLKAYRRRRTGMENPGTLHRTVYIQPHESDVTT